MTRQRSEKGGQGGRIFGQRGEKVGEGGKN